MYTICNAGLALLGELGMSESSSALMGVVAFLAILTVSAGTMLWLFWRFPLTTAIVTLGVFTALGILAKLSRSIDVEMKELDRTKQGV